MNLQLNAIYCYENICILHVACVIMFNYDHGDWLRSSENTIVLYINPIKHCHTIVSFLIVILCVDSSIGMYLSCFTGLDDLAKCNIICLKHVHGLFVIKF